MLLASVATGCGDGVHSITDLGEPLAVFRVALDRPLVSSDTDELRAAVVWGRVPAADDACLAQVTGASPNYGCLPIFDFEAVAASSAVTVTTSATGVLEVPVHVLPPLELLAGDGDGRLGYGALALWRPGFAAELDVGPQTAARIVATSMAAGAGRVALVTFREGAVAPAWSMFTLLGCAQPPRGFAVAEVAADGRGGFACELSPPEDVTLVLADATGCSPAGGAGASCFSCAAGCPAVADAQRWCVAGQCGFVCDPGHADCNLQQADGCESPELDTACRERGPWGQELVAVLDLLEDPLDPRQKSFDGSRSIPSFGRSIVSYRYDFGDGSAPSGWPDFAPATATHRYAQPGGYVARLLVTDTAGVTSEARRQLQVAAPDGSLPPSLVTSEDSPGTTALPEQVTLRALVVPGTAAISPVWWESGGRSLAVGRVLTRQLDARNAEQVRALTVDAEGRLAADERVIGPPEAVALGLTAWADRRVGEAPLSVRLDCHATGRELTETLWFAGDDTEPVAGESVVHDYRSPGTYLAHCLASADGATASASVLIEVTAGGRSPPRFFTGNTVPSAVACLGERYGGAEGAWVPVLGSAPLSFRLTGAADDQPPPAGAVIDAATGILSWTPTADQVGALAALRVVAENASGAAEVTWTVEVAATCPSMPPAAQGNDAGCGCRGTTPTAALWVLLAVAASRRRYRRA